MSWSLARTPAGDHTQQAVRASLFLRREDALAQSVQGCHPLRAGAPSRIDRGCHRVHVPDIIRPDRGEVRRDGRRPSVSRRQRSRGTNLARPPPPSLAAPDDRGRQSVARTAFWQWGAAPCATRRKSCSSRTHAPMTRETRRFWREASTRAGPTKVMRRIVPRSWPGERHLQGRSDTTSPPTQFARRGGATISTCR